MKIEQKTEQKFKPITLTIENKEELLVMLSLIGGTSVSYLKDITGNKQTDTEYMYKMYGCLEKIAVDIGIESHKTSIVKATSIESYLE